MHAEGKGQFARLIVFDRVEQLFERAGIGRIGNVRMTVREPVSRLRQRRDLLPALLAERSVSRAQALLAAGTPHA